MSEEQEPDLPAATPSEDETASERAPETAPEDTSASEARASELVEEAPAVDASASDADVTSEPDANAEPAEEPVAAEAPEPAVEPAAPEPVAAEAPVEPVAPEPVAEQAEDFEPVPRVRPEIPGADLIPDFAPDGDEYLDAEARAAAEAEAEAAAAREREEADDEPQPIADAAIDLAAGARYTATGKRKTAVARVILKPGSGTYLINGKTLESFFPRETLQRVIRQPLEAVGYESRMDVVARMHGGGVAAQAGALRHGIARALLEADPHLRGELKRRGFLTRDPRVKERKKAGLKKARKRPQFSKR